MNIRTVLLRVLIPVENGLSWLIDRLDPPPADPERVDGVEPAWPVTGFDGRVIGLGAFRAGES